MQSNMIQRVEGGRRTLGLGRTEKPLVTIITVVFRAKDELKDILNNVFEHNTDDFEFIVIDANSGDQGGITEGIFEFWWRGETLFARNNAVGDSYLFAWSTWPEEASGQAPQPTRERALIWRANYHPDGGQLVYPMNGESFVVPLALPGDDVTPDRFVTFWCSGTRGLYIHPNVWHGAFVPLDDHARFRDRQGRVHARVSVDFPKEFGCYLASPLRHAR